MQLESKRSMRKVIWVPSNEAAEVQWRAEKRKRSRTGASAPPRERRAIDNNNLIISETYWTYKEVSMVKLWKRTGKNEIHFGDPSTLPEDFATGRPLCFQKRSQVDNRI